MVIQGYVRMMKILIVNSLRYTCMKIQAFYSISVMHAAASVIAAVGNKNDF
jgi:hypothetical protein